MASDEDGIRATFAEWDEAGTPGDLDRWIEVFTDDAIFMAPDTPVLNGKQAIYDWGKEAFFDVFDMTLINSPEDIRFCQISDLMFLKARVEMQNSLPIKPTIRPLAQPI